MAEPSKVHAVATATGLELVELIKIVPRLLWRAIVGMVAGGLLGGVLGSVLLLVTHLMGWGGASGLTAWALAVASVAAIAVGGAYIAGLRGCAVALASAIDERGWVDKLWLGIRPHVEGYVTRIRQGAAPKDARSDAMADLGAAPGSAAAGLPERVERLVAKMVHGALTGGLLGAMMNSVDRSEGASWAQIEADGRRMAGEAVGDMIARMFHGPTLVALFLTVVVAITPHVVAVLLAAA